MTMFLIINVKGSPNGDALYEEYLFRCGMSTIPINSEEENCSLIKNTGNKLIAYFFTKEF